MNFVLFLKENKNDKGYAKRNCLKLFENTNTYRVVRCQQNQRTFSKSNIQMCNKFVAL